MGLNWLFGGRSKSFIAQLDNRMMELLLTDLYVSTHLTQKTFGWTPMTEEEFYENLL